MDGTIKPQQKPKQLNNQPPRLSSKDFSKELTAELNELPTAQCLAFARRCALHALPYLFHQGHMDFWPESERLKHTYAIFNVLDYCHAGVISAGYEIKIDAARAAADAADAANAAAYAADSAYAAYAAAAYANAAYAANANAAYANVGVGVAAAAAAGAVYQANNSNIQPQLRQELRRIANNQPFSKLIECPNDIWQGFQQALIDADCGYWADLYQQIFDNDFEVEPKALEQRLNLPVEIKAQGAAVVANYLTQLAQQGAEQLNESRILILGDKGAGKTCLARRLLNPSAEMTTVAESTAGVATSIWTLANTKVRIWDFAGHTVTHAVHQFFLSERCLYILVCDGRTEHTQRLSYWLDHVKNYGGDSQTIILINQKDPHQVTIPINKLKAKYNIDAVFNFSIADEEPIRQFGATIADKISNTPCWNKQQIPSHYYQVKAQLEQLFNSAESNQGNGEEQIEKTQFEAIAKAHGVESPEQLLSFLNDLGISLWYPDLAEYNTLVLNPEWISHGIYQLINWVANQSKANIIDSPDSAAYAISLEQFSQVFNSAQDQQRFGSHHRFLFDLIKYYELAYESDPERNQLIIPHLLPEDQPDADRLPSFDIGESLMVKFVAKHPLPPHTISRFIVRHHQQIKSNQLVWREGVVLSDEADNHTLALVKEDDRTISIAVTGKNKSIFISSLRDTIQSIFNSYKSDKPELFYEVIPIGPHQQPVTLTEPLLLPEKTISNHLAREQDYFESQTGQDINLQSTARNYSIKIENLIVGDHAQVAKDHASITTNNFNLQDSNFALQGGFNELIDEISSHSTEPNQQHIGSLTTAIQALEKAENCETSAELKKSGAASRVKRLLEEMGDKNSSLHKTIEGTQKGINIAQELAAKYNSIAQWGGLPQVPEWFLQSKKG